MLTSFIGKKTWRVANDILIISIICSEFKDKAPFSGFFTMFTPYLLATDPGLLKQMFIKDFKKFRNNDFTVRKNFVDKNKL